MWGTGEQLAEHARCGRSSTVLDAVSLSLTEGAAAQLHISGIHYGFGDL
jgi:hypothetical protein